MPRVKRGVTAHRRHKKILSQAKGFRGKRKNVFKLAKNAVMKAGQNAYRDRRLKKRTFHQLWILRINAACREHDLKYSRFIYGLELAGIEINRKMLAELAVSEPDVFKEIVDKAKAAIPKEGAAPQTEKAHAKPKIEAPVKAEKAEEKAEVKEVPEKTEEKVEVEQEVEETPEAELVEEEVAEESPAPAEEPKEETPVESEIESESEEPEKKVDEEETK